MLDTDEIIWAQFASSALQGLLINDDARSAGQTVAQDAAEHADILLREYKERFPNGN